MVKNMSKNHNKKSNKNKIIKKQLNKFNKTTKIICFFLFFLSFFGGIFTTYYLTRNDTFELIGETHLILNIGDKYIEKGAKIIAFGKDISNQVEITGSVNTEVADN